MDALQTLQKLWDLVQDDRLKETYLTLRTQILDLKEENVHLRELNVALQSERPAAARLTYDGKMYWDNTTEKPDGPFCPTCYDNDQKVIRLGEAHRGRRCAVCKTYIRTEPEPPPEDPYRGFRGGSWTA